MENQIKNKVKSIMSLVFEIPVKMIDDESSPNSIKSWDSLKHMNLVTVLEEEFNVRLSASEMLTIQNVSDLIAMLGLKTIDRKN